MRKDRPLKNSRFTEDPLEEEQFIHAEESSPWLEALGSYVILESVEPKEQKTVTGLVIPPTAQPPKGAYGKYRVVAVGPLCSEDRISEFPDPSLSPGDLVLAPVDEVKIYREGNRVFYIVDYELIAAIVREK